MEEESKEKVDLWFTSQQFNYTEMGKNLNTAPDNDDDKELLERCPPDFEWAKKHREANKVKTFEFYDPDDINIDDENLYCKCCKLPLEKAVPLHPLWTDTKNLQDLGAGFPLYYQFKIFTIIVYLVMILVVGIAGIIINLREDKTKEWDKDTSFVAEISIGSHGESKDEYRESSVTLQIALNSWLLILIYLGSIVLRCYQEKLINEIDEKNLTPSDFGVMVTGLPRHKTQEEVKDWFKSHFEDLEIVYVSFWYDIDDMVRVARRVKYFSQIRSYLIAYKEKMLRMEGMTEGEATQRKLVITPPPSKYWCCLKKPYPPFNVLNRVIK